MKKNQIIFLLILAAFNSGFSHAETTAPPFSLLENHLSRISSPAELVKWMKKKFKFADDREMFHRVDYWQSPEEFWEHGAGDCEDYALFAHYALERLGVESYVVSIYGARRYAHTILIYKENERYNVINEDRLYRFQAETVEDALSQVNPEWTWAGIAEEHDKRGWLVFALENTR